MLDNYIENRDCLESSDVVEGLNKETTVLNKYKAKKVVRYLKTGIEH